MALSPKVSLALVAACSLAAVTPSVATAQNISIDGRFSPASTLLRGKAARGAYARFDADARSRDALAAEARGLLRRERPGRGGSGVAAPGA
jgi:hypothetical protein